MKPPLAGVRVLDLGTLTPGKYCTFILAALGADVIRVERPMGGNAKLDAEDLALNQGKRSMTLNLRSEAGLGLLLQLAKSADVVIEGNRPGTADRNGFGYEGIRAVNRTIVYVAISAYGASGPMNQAVGYDLMFLGLSGLLRTLTGSDIAPTSPETYLADGVTGLTAVCAVTTALLARERAGEGQFVDLSMLDSAFSMLAVSHGFRRMGGSAAAAPADSPTYTIYRAAEDTYIALCAIRPVSMERLFEHLDGPELASSRDTAAVSSFLTTAFRRKTATEWVAELMPLDIEIAEVKQPNEAFDYPQLRERGMVGEGNHPDVGSFEYIRSGHHLSGVGAELSAAPQVGEHTDELLSSIGMTAEEIRQFRAEGVV